MKDELIRATAKDGQIRIICATTTNLVQEGCRIHNCSPTASAALGRLLTAGSLMGAMLKSEKDILTIKITGDGPAKGLIVTSQSDASVKGYIGNPKADLPPNEKGKLDVGGLIGKDGGLFVIRDLGLKEPYVGQVPLATGEIGDDLAYYFTVSEQTPSAVGLGVLVDKDLSIKAAGGFIIQMMPGAEELLADFLTYRLEEVPSVTKLISDGMSAEDMLKFIFEDMDLKILDREEPKYKCNCSRERVERALISIGEKDLRSIYDEEKEEEIVCDFCNKSYKFSHDDLGILLKNIK